MAMGPIFRGFCVGIGPLHYIWSRSNFGFKFGEIFVIEKWLADMAIRGVADSQTRQVGESLILWLGESGSLWLSDLAGRGVNDSPTRRGESESLQLKV